MAQIQAPCRACKRNTSHGLLWQEKEQLGYVDDYEEAYELRDYCYWQIIRCMGCQTVSFRTYHTDYWDGDPDDSEVVGEQFFPPSGIGKHELKAFNHLPQEIAKVYTEVVQAYNADLYTLATMGVRMVIEGICNVAGITVKGIYKKIKALQEKGWLTAPHVLILQELRDQGNEAAHELTTPSSKQIKQYLKILETTLEVAFEFEGQQKLMELERQTRQNRNNQ